MLKITLTRLLVSRPWTNRGHFKSKSTHSKDEDIETPAPGANEQPTLVDRRRDFSDDSQSATSLSRGFHLDEFAYAFKRSCNNLASISCKLNGRTTRVGTTAEGLSYAVSLLFPLLHIGQLLDRRRYDFMLLRVERARRRTFHAWQNGAVSPRDLARDGFYFTGVDDVVQCVFCLGVLDGWYVEDDDGIPRDQYPARRHRHQLSYCPFVRGFDVHDVPDNDHDEPEGAGDLGLHVRLHKLLTILCSLLLR